MNKKYNPAPNQHKNIAKARGKKWKANLARGRREALLKPSFLRLVRLNKGLDQEDIAKRLKISTSAWGAIERAKQPVKSKDAEAIAKIFGRPVKFFFKEPDNKGKCIAKLQNNAI